MATVIFFKPCFCKAQMNAYIDVDVNPFDISRMMGEIPQKAHITAWSGPFYILRKFFTSAILFLVITIHHKLYNKILLSIFITGNSFEVNKCELSQLAEGILCKNTRIKAQTSSHSVKLSCESVCVSKCVYLYGSWISKLQ